MSALHLDAENPWPGLESFDEASAAFFHGREAEAGELLLALRRTPLTVLYGQSGLGKTSLLQAGLFPRLRDTDFLPVYIRLDHGEDSPPLVEQVRQRLSKAAREAHCELPPLAEGESLWAYFHRRDLDIWSERNRPLTSVLVFDQFEELFTLGRRATAHAADVRFFLSALACLVENRVPAELGQELEHYPERVERFDFRKQDYKLLFAFREDFLPEVEGLRRLMPSIAHNRLRLLPLNRPHALEVVEKSGGALLTHEVADQIVRFVAAAQQSQDISDSADALLPSEAAVEPALLSLVCAGLNSHRKERGLAAISADLLESCHRAIIEDFYTRSLVGLNPAVRAFIEDALLTRAGHRDSRALDDALAVPDVTREAIDRLVARRLLRIEDRYGQKRLELTHDRLTGAVRESRDRRRAEEAAAEAHRKTQMRRKHWLLAGASLLGLVLVLSAFAGYSFVQWRRAEEQTRRAEQRKQAMMDAINRLTYTVPERLLQRPGTADLAREIFEANLALLERLMDQEGETPKALREKSVNCTRMGDLWVQFGDLGKALGIYHTGLDIAKRLVGQDPSNMDWQRDLAVSHERIGDVLSTQTDLGGALKVYRVSLGIRERLASQDASNTQWQGDLAISYEKIGDVLSAQSDLGGALKAYRAGLAIRERLVEQNASNTQWQRDLSASHNKIGNVLFDQGEFGEALMAYRSGLAIVERLAGQDASNTQWQRDFSVSHEKIADALAVQGDLEGALEAYRASFAIRERLAGQDANNTQWQRDISVSHNKIGNVLSAQGHLGGALKAYRSGLAIAERLADQDVSNNQWQRDLSVSHEKIGDVLFAQGDLGGALKAYRSTLAIAERLARQDASNPERQRDVAISQMKLGTIYEAQGKTAKAREYYEKAKEFLLSLHENHPDWVVIKSDLDWLERRLKIRSKP